MFSHFELFFYLGFLSGTFTIHSTEAEGEGGGVNTGFYPVRLFPVHALNTGIYPSTHS